MDIKISLICGPVEHVTFRKTVRNRVHKHAFYEPCIVVSGRGEFEHDGQAHALNAGDVFIARPGAFHEIRSLNTRDLELYFLSFAIVPEKVEKRAQSHIVLSQTLLAPLLFGDEVWFSGLGYLVPLFRFVHGALRERTLIEEPALLHDTMQLLMQQLLSAIAAESPAVPNQASDQGLVPRVHRFIDGHMESNFTIGALAKALGVSERTLRRRWARASRHTLRHYIMMRRMERACQLLALQDMPVYEVGLHVGILDAAQFSRRFKTLIGTSPSAYRAQLSQALNHNLSGPLPYRTEFQTGEIKQY